MLASGVLCGPILIGCTADRLAAEAPLSDSEVADVPAHDPPDLPARDSGGEPVRVDSGDPTPRPCICPGGRCVQRESDPAELCALPCRAQTCPDRQVCLTFPPDRLCLPAGSGAPLTWCTTGSDCAGGLCLYSGGSARFCSRECGGAADSSCPTGWSCLPALTPQGAWHCYPTGDVPTGGHCSQLEPHVCQGGFCLGPGHSAYCTHQCGMDHPPCPKDWPCEPHEGGYLCQNSM